MLRCQAAITVSTFQKFAAIHVFSHPFGGRTRQGLVHRFRHLMVDQVFCLRSGEMEDDMSTAAADEAEDICTVVDLKDLIRDLRVNKGYDNAKIAAELDRLKIEPTGWTAFRVQCLVRGFKIYKKWGRKRTSQRRAWREHVEPALRKLTPGQRAEFYRTTVAEAARAEARHPRPDHLRDASDEIDYEAMIDEETGESWC